MITSSTSQVYTPSSKASIPDLPTTKPAPLLSAGTAASTVQLSSVGAMKHTPPPASPVDHPYVIASWPALPNNVILSPAYANVFKTGNSQSVTTTIVNGSAVPSYSNSKAYTSTVATSTTSSSAGHAQKAQQIGTSQPNKQGQPSITVTTGNSQAVKTVVSNGLAHPLKATVPTLGNSTTQTANTVHNKTLGTPKKQGEPTTSRKRPLETSQSASDKVYTIPWF